GEACLQGGDWPLAVKHLKLAYELKPDLVAALHGLGEAYTGFDKADMALPVYKKVLETNPDHPTIRKDLAIALINLGRMDEATVYLK
ncbi:tetratricopeptide repeat protein, partial [Mesorhizobium japonicum]|uniref:tetratricopeptide repeat protein n=1 Tax=Mesorhizobium japonicum TaxID=2066070 RepID=UPI003B5ABB03